jgi:hypothetical protein
LKNLFSSWVLTLKFWTCLLADETTSLPNVDKARGQSRFYSGITILHCHWYLAICRSINLIKYFNVTTQNHYSKSNIILQFINIIIFLALFAFCKQASSAPQINWIIQRTSVSKWFNIRNQNREVFRIKSIIAQKWLNHEIQ